MRRCKNTPYSKARNCETDGNTHITVGANGNECFARGIGWEDRKYGGRVPAGSKALGRGAGGQRPQQQAPTSEQVYGAAGWDRLIK